MQHFKHVALVYLFLHVLCQLAHKNTSITRPLTHPETGPDIQSYGPECLNKFRQPTFWLSLNQKKKKKMEQEMIICISAKLSSRTLPDKMNAVKP